MMPSDKVGISYFLSLVRAFQAASFAIDTTCRATVGGLAVVGGSECEERDSECECLEEAFTFALLLQASTHG